MGIVVVILEVPLDAELPLLGELLLLADREVEPWEAVLDVMVDDIVGVLARLSLLEDELREVVDPEDERLLAELEPDCVTDRLFDDEVEPEAVCDTELPDDEPPLPEDALLEVLGKLVCALAELADVLAPVVVTADVLRPLEPPPTEDVVELGDCGGELVDDAVKLCVIVIGVELRDPAGELADVLRALDDELLYCKSVDRAAFPTG